jgi:hypothetical protein
VILKIAIVEGKNERVSKFNLVRELALFLPFLRNGVFALLIRPASDARRYPFEAKPLSDDLGGPIQHGSGIHCFCFGPASRNPGSLRWAPAWGRGRAASSAIIKRANSVRSEYPIAPKT